MTVYIRVNGVCFNSHNSNQLCSYTEAYLGRGEGVEVINVKLMIKMILWIKNRVTFISFSKIKLF